jgi:hypothetical protein
MLRLLILEGLMKKTWIWITAAILALALLVTGMVTLYLKFRPQPVEGDKHITVTVIHKDGSEKEFTYDTDEEYLGTLLQADGLIEGEEGPYGLMISTVDGELADWNVDQGYWALYIGQDYATTGIDTTPIQDGAAYSLVYTIG